MEEHDKNKLFKFFLNRHDLPLTQDEIDEIVAKISKYDDMHLVRIVIHRLNTYRIINVVLMTLLILPTHLIAIKALPWMCYLFVLYNIIHVIVGYWKLRKRKKANKKLFDA